MISTDFAKFWSIYAVAYTDTILDAMNNHGQACISAAALVLLGAHVG